MRMTFPRSQGKQIYYDARKSNWGDLFPHTPKHRPVLRYIGSKTKESSPALVKSLQMNAEDEPLTKQEEAELNRLMGLEESSREKLNKQKRKLEKGLARGRGGEGALGKAGLATQGRASWAGVTDDLIAENRVRRRERRRERDAKDEEFEEI